MNRIENCTPPMLRQLADVAEANPLVFSRPHLTTPRTVSVEMDDVLLVAFAKYIGQ